MSDREAKTGLKIIMNMFVFGATLLAFCIAGFAGYVAYEYDKANTREEPAIIIIGRGDPIAEKLAENGLIDNPFIFKLAGRVTGQATKLKAGEYEIPPQSSIRDILTQMEEGKTVERRFTVREGLTSYETVQIVKAVENLSGEITRIPPEGALLPNTYDYQKDEPRDAALGRMQEAMVTVLIELCGLNEGLSFDAMMEMDCKNASTPLKTVEQVLTLASIVEKETAVPEERERVAGVFINRLKRGIALQTDPTVIYAITKGKHQNDGLGPLGRRLLSKDLNIDSPYNTYKYPGLPPGPIANPGRASIEAVLSPESHDYIYFVADGTGGHAFAKTLTEHNANVAKWRKIRRAQSTD